MTNNSIDLPSIAQLVERRTVEVKMISLGRWFKSGSREIFFVFENDPYGNHVRPVLVKNEHLNNLVNIIPDLVYLSKYRKESWFY